MCTAGHGVGYAGASHAHAREAKTPLGRVRATLTACGTRHESVSAGSVAASMPPHGPASGEDTTADGFTWRLGMSQTQRSRPHGNTLDGCGSFQWRNVGLSTFGKRRARMKRGTHATPGSCKRRGEGSVSGLRCQPVCRSFRGSCSLPSRTSGRRATVALRDEARPKPRSRKAAAICFYESRIPYPVSRPLKHPAPTPSAPAPATPDAPAA